MLKIGIISPISKEYPFLSRDLEEGLELALHRNGDIKLVPMEAGRGSPNDVTPVFRHLIIREKVDIIVAFIDAISIKTVSDLIEQCRVPVICTGMGARLPLTATQPDSCLLYNTYRMWESCWLAGNLASNTLGKKAGSISSFFDSGFPLVYAHSKGTETSGGYPVFFNITHKDLPEQEFALIQQNMQTYDVDYYFISSFGKERGEILDWLSRNGIPDERIVVSPSIHSLGQEKALTVSSWFKDLEMPENVTFVNEYKATTKHQVNEFSMLGYETGLWIKQSLENDKTEFDSTSFLQQMKTAVFSGPRGLVRVNNNQMAYTSHYLPSPDNETGKMQYQQLDYPLWEVEQEIAANSITNVIGWQNTYLCK